MKNINAKLLQQFIKAAHKKLKGDWVILGGTVLPLLGLDKRVTVDIDLVPKTKQKNSQQLELIELADKLGLPIETINSSGAFFLYQQKNYLKELILEKKGTHCNIYRPNLFLYLSLKLERMSSSDMMDCYAYAEYTVEHEENTDLTREIELVANFKQPGFPERKKRRQELLAELRKMNH